MTKMWCNAVVWEYFIHIAGPRGWNKHFTWKELTAPGQIPKTFCTKTVSTWTFALLASYIQLPSRLLI